MRLRDLFRGIIRVLVLIFIMVSCTETFYFMGELSKNTANLNKNPRYPSYYRSSTRETSYYNEEEDSILQDLSYEENVSKSELDEDGYY